MGQSDCGNGLKREHNSAITGKHGLAGWEQQAAQSKGMQ
jgi:hypothetical protein